MPDVLAQSGAVAARSRHDQPHARRATTRRRSRDRTAAAPARASRPTSESRASRSGRRSTDLAALARQFSIPLVEDLGSGWLGLRPTRPPPFATSRPCGPASTPAPTSSRSAATNSSAVPRPASSSAAARWWTESARTRSCARVRADKLTYAALEATLALWAQTPSREQRADLPHAHDDAWTRSITARGSSRTGSSESPASASASSTASRRQAAAARPSHSCRRGCWLSRSTAGARRISSDNYARATRRSSRGFRMTQSSSISERWQKETIWSLSARSARCTARTANEQGQRVVIGRDRSFTQLLETVGRVGNERACLGVVFVQVGHVGPG